jgi:hypothetical protein
MFSGAIKPSCTMGVNANHSWWGAGFLTASHCLHIQGWIGSDTYFQPYHLFSYDTIGVEVEDAPSWTGGSCPSGRQCQLTGAAFVAYDNANNGEFGTIAQPTFLCVTSCNGNASAWEISTTNPRWYIVSDWGLPQSFLHGMWVHKVGTTSGWGSGEVIATCYDRNDDATNFTHLCQTKSNGHIYGGDSGGPVFRITSNPNQVQFVGIAYAGTEAGTVFGTWTQIKNAIGYYGTYTTH